MMELYICFRKLKLKIRLAYFSRFYASSQQPIFVNFAILPILQIFDPLRVFLNILGCPLKPVKYERGDLGLSFKWSNKFVASKFEKLLKFENRQKSEHFLPPECYFDQKHAKLWTLNFFFHIRNRKSDLNHPSNFQPHWSIFGDFRGGWNPPPRL